ncbi:MAG: ABC transporter permease subunit [Lachnospiraceae bacterium]|nr:ABC transporter permease subunit [Lachnospiraceae bacterium]
MRKLLSANFARLWKNKVFWICILVTLVYNTIVMLNGGMQAANLIEEGEKATLEMYYFNFAPVLGLLCAVFSSLFMGTEYSDGTIRNKIVAGHTRTHVYLANFVVCFAAGLCFITAWLLSGLVGIPYLGLWKLNILSLCMLILIAVLFTAAFTGIFTLLGSLITNKAIMAVVMILLFLAMLLVTSWFNAQLEQPEMWSGITMTENGIEMGDPMPNPYYVTGKVRTVYEWVLDLLPTGQSIYMANLKIVHPVREMILSVLITLSTLGAGLAAFKRKNLN